MVFWRSLNESWLNGVTLVVNGFIHDDARKMSVDMQCQALQG